MTAAIEFPEGPVTVMFAEMLLHRGQDGDRERARALLIQAIEGYEVLGMRLLVENARGLLV